jgi:hypothetical protein
LDDLIEMLKAAAAGEASDGSSSNALLCLECDTAGFDAFDNNNAALYDDAL